MTAPAFQNSGERGKTLFLGGGQDPSKCHFNFDDFEEAKGPFFLGIAPF